MLVTQSINKYYGKYKQYTTILKTLSSIYTFTTTPSPTPLSIEASISSLNYGMNFTSPGRRVGTTAVNPAAKI